MDEDDFYDYVRAYDFPGYEPEFIIENGIKKHLVLQARAGNEERIWRKDIYYYADRK